MTFFLVSHVFDSVQLLGTLSKRPEASVRCYIKCQSCEVVSLVGSLKLTCNSAKCEKCSEYNLTELALCILVVTSLICFCFQVKVMSVTVSGTLRQTFAILS